MRTAILVVLAAALAGCNDLSQRWELDHARVLAVRLSAPGLAPGGVATVDALVVDDAGAPTVVAPRLVGLADSADAAVVTVAPGGGGWTVTAGDAAAIAAARAAAGLTDDQPLAITLGTIVTIAGVDHVATKQVRLGEALVNPPTPVIHVDGVAATDTPAPVAFDRDVALTLGGVTPADELAFDWLTSTGALTHSETAAATLTLAPDDARTGHVVAIVRSDGGGAAWATAAIAAP
ncbi:MAG: hypothetical protein IPH44_20635 [Myxococcales bacterium]|nr:hypothetical protein [Myxococcales bacterium]MBK7195225.1 hypothetical protein [Myxococcales bacterium]MBP6845582.1 hypothetical protein [Kofleriaceae bacterium]